MGRIYKSLLLMAVGKQILDQVPAPHHLVDLRDAEPKAGVPHGIYKQDFLYRSKVRTVLQR